MVRNVVRLLCGLLLTGVALGQPLQARGLANLEAFTRASGYVFYFHPSDAVAGTAWEGWTAHVARSVPRIEVADSAEALAMALEATFAPFAPTVRFHPTGAESDPDAAPEVAAPPQDATRVVFRTYMPSVHLGSTDSAGRLFGRDASLLSVPLEEGRVPAVAGPGPYRRSLRELDAGDLTLEVPHPSEPYRAELPGGVTVEVPLALYATEEATLPRQEAPEAAPFDAAAPGLDRSLRIATVMRVWNALQHFFPYWDVVDVDWAYRLRLALRDAALAPDAEAFLVTLRELTAALHDGHTSTFNARLIGPEGILRPPFEAALVEGRLVVAWVVEDATLPFAPGDAIVEVEGEPALEALGRTLAHVSPVGQLGEMRAIARLLASARSDATLHITIEPHGGGVPYEVAVPRVTRRATHLREPRPPAVARLAPGVLYVDLTRVQASRFHAVMEHLQEADGLVFDLRGRPTASFVTRLLGYLSPTPLVFDTFYRVLVTRPDGVATRFVRSSDTWSRPVRPEQRLTANRAFLTNANGTVSFAEVILSFLAEHELGARVGRPSGGANGEWVELLLPGGYSTSWTGDKVVRADGSPLFTVGIAPTVPVERTLAGVAAGRDELLEAAFEVVAGEPADAMRVEEIPYAYD